MKKVCLAATLCLLVACDQHSWNDPYPKSEAKGNIRYASFNNTPKTLDPARSYSEDESIFTGEIYEPPLQYHFLKRPYTLIPLTASTMPTVSYLDQHGNKVAADSKNIAFTAYDIAIKPGIYYQPHPAFAKNAEGQYAYLALKQADIHKIHTLSNFSIWGTRELVADDYVYEIKRLAAPGVNSPIYGFMAGKIVGLSDFAKLLNQQKPSNGWLDLRKYPLQGAFALDRYHYRILIKENYPQFIYWLAMPFFAPIPWEADAFYSQPGMEKKNMSFDWYPVGTGAYTLSENNPNRRMVLSKNPNFHEEYYPSEGAPGDKEAGYLNDAGKRLPFIDKVVFTLEKESIPRWTKFLQGYYDISTISSDSFDQAIQIDKAGNPSLTPLLKDKGIYLQASPTQTIFYFGFNMLDKVVGGHSERARKLRLAISIAVDFEEYKNIFLNGRGKIAQGPLPPGIFGYQEGPSGINPHVYQWQDGQPVRKSLTVARRLMKEAGYPNGIDPKTKLPLIVNYDLASTSGPDEKSLLEWLRAQFAKIGIQLNIRNTDYNRFQHKIRLGEGQVFTWGWIADYPDPENFLFLLYGPNSKTLYGGENASNYQNKDFDKLFNLMKNMPNTPERLAIIHQMLAIIQRDAPWMWGIYQENFTLNQAWDYPSKPNILANNYLKYLRLNPLLRDKLRDTWNHPILWPLGLMLLLFIVVSAPVFIRYRKKEQHSVKEQK